MLRWTTLFLTLILATYAVSQPVNLPKIVALMNLSEEAKQRLLRDGVLVLADWSETNLWKAYDDLTRFHDVPVFVTTDACLYQFYELHKTALEEAEGQGFSPLLQQLTKDWATTAYKAISMPKVQKDARHAAFILAVAGKLMDEKFHVPKELQLQVSTIVREIVSAQKVVEGEPFGEDFTQYKPRGHYASSEPLQRYFRAFKWLSRRVYDVQKVEQLKQAVMLTWLLEQTPKGFERYAKLVNSVIQLTGEPIGIPLNDLRRAIDAIGKKPEQVLNDLDALRALQKELEKPEYGEARIVTHPVPAIAIPPPQLMPRKQIRPLPEIQLLDSEVIQWTSDPQVPNRLPSGLDVATALGSQRAAELLRQTPNGTLVLERIKPFQQALAEFKPEDWQKSVYRLWLWAIKSVLEMDESAPKFMQTPIWQDWKLNTALASWAQLRHAYGLYAAPVYIYQSLQAGIPSAYLEPNPNCYKRLAMATESLQRVLKSTQASSAKTETNLRWFTFLMYRLAEIAEKERRGEALSEKDLALLNGFADAIFMLPRETPVTVIDIATHSQTGQVLHVASGKLHPVLVVVEAKPYPPFVAVGWSLSYYEFVRPNFERMTDVDWERWLNRDIVRPEPPFWANSFRWSAVESLDGFADLQHAESLLATEPEKAVKMLRQVAQQHKGSWVGAKANLLLARHFMERSDFENALSELNEFYRASNYRLMREADEISWELRGRWKRFALWQLAQPYLQRLLKLTEPPKKPLPAKEELRRQNLRAKTLLLQLALLPIEGNLPTWLEKRGKLAEQTLKECPKSHFVPTAKAFLWWYRYMAPIVRWFERLPKEQERRKLFSEAFRIIKEHPSSEAAWFVAEEIGKLSSPLFMTLSEAEELNATLSRLKRPPEWLSEEETQLLEAAGFSPPFYPNPLTISELLELSLMEDNFAKALEFLKKSPPEDYRLKPILEAWKREGEKVARALWSILRAREMDDVGAVIQFGERFVNQFPKSRWTLHVLLQMREVYELLGEEEKAKAIDEKLVKQYPHSEEAKSLLAHRQEKEGRRKEQIKEMKSFLTELLRGKRIDPKPYLAQTDLPTTLDKLLENHPEEKEHVVKFAMSKVIKDRWSWLAETLRDWLLNRFAERYPNDPLAYEVKWQLEIAERKASLSLSDLPLLAPFVTAPEGIPYRQEAEKLIEEILAKEYKRTIEHDPFLTLLEFTAQFPQVRPRLLLAAGEWSMRMGDWMTAKSLLEQAEKESDEKLRQRIQDAMAKLAQLQQPSRKVAKKLWMLDLWERILPKPIKLEDCIKALRILASDPTLIDRADTDGQWFVMSDGANLICMELSTGKIVWRRKVHYEGFGIISGIVLSHDSFMRSPSENVWLVEAIDAKTGKALWKREFSGERISLGRWKNLLVIAQYDTQKDKGKVTFIDPRSGQKATKQPLTWDEFLKRGGKLQAIFSLYKISDMASLTDEQGRLVKMWVCENNWKSPDGTTVVVLLPDGKLVAYRLVDAESTH